MIPKMKVSDAYFSPDRKHRYWLIRIWDDKLPVMANIGANPSTADEIKNDRTVSKDIGFAQRLCYGGLLKLNVGGFRATKPQDWYQASDPFGPKNTPKDFIRYIEQFNAKIVVAAWGEVIGPFAYAGERIRVAIPELWCFGCTANGSPRHTCRIPYDTPLEPYGMAR